MLISATHKSSGKTLVTVGLAAALRAQGHRVQCFKKGPDYIDPMWLTRASGIPCRNLDFYTMSEAEISEFFSLSAGAADSIIVEASKGLHDGLATDGSDSSGALAKLLNLPVVLVVDASGITRGVAPLLHGYQTFDPKIQIAGIILNKVGGERHRQKLLDAIRRYSSIPVLGVIPRSEFMEIEERNIGLIPDRESRYADARIAEVARVVKESVDMEQLSKFVRPGSEHRSNTYPPRLLNVSEPISIGVARDEAFGFYYSDDLELFKDSGIDVQYFEPVRDRRLPRVDALFIGGGFPELFLEELAGNTGLRSEIRQFIEQGRPVYAECGGLMYLCRQISNHGRTLPMVGAISADAKMGARPVGRGYVQLRNMANHPWPVLNLEPSQIIPAHEFHYSQLENRAPDVRFAYEVMRGVGIAEGYDGLVYKNTLATYSHHRNVGNNQWAERFVAHIVNCRDGHNTGHRTAV